VTPADKGAAHPSEFSEPEQEREPVVIRDKRRIDPETGEVRPGARGSHPQATPDPAAGSAEVGALQEALAERTADVQRLQAEYANYRKRADRERLAAGEIATGRVLADLLPVLDDIDRAREHGDLTGALKAIAGKLSGIVDKLGLQSFGEVGDRFDPSVHEAVLHAESDEVSEPTCTTVMRKGYQHGDRLLRAAMVGVTDPATPVSSDAMTSQSSDENEADDDE
jgi:molecular chaperone GrpE